MKFITQGAEGKVYSAEWLGLPVIVKKRFRKKYRHPDLDSQITKNRMKAEAKALVRCHAIGLRVPILYDVNFESQEIIMQEIQDCVSVRSHIETIARDYIRAMDGDSVVSFAESIGKCLGCLHVNHVIHGDLTTSNLMISNTSKEITLIDFGLSYTSEHDEDKAVDLYVLERAILSTHPLTDKFVEVLFKAYVKFDVHKLSSVITRLDDVRARGRKKLCFG